MGLNSTTPQLHTVYSVTQLDEMDVFLLDVEITDMNGEKTRCAYVSRSGDEYGLNPVIQRWLTDNAASYVVQPYMPLSPEQVRASLPAVTARQLRLILVRSGISVAAVDAAIDALEAGTAKEEAEIEWEYATTFERLSPTLLTIASALGLSPEKVDAMWEQALAI